MKTFVCRGCVNPITGTGRTSVDIGDDANLELVDRFRYSGDMLSVDADADEMVRARAMKRCRLKITHEPVAPWWPVDFVQFILINQ